jgi:hypothetical protein
MAAIHVFVEGGDRGQRAPTRRRAARQTLRQAFQTFFRRALAVDVRVAMGGSRRATYDLWSQKRHTLPAGTFPVLLVDAEGRVTQAPSQHLRDKDGWDLSTASDEQCHLMVEVMEAWFLADADALGRFYGPGFSRRRLPRRQNVEQIPKEQVQDVLTNATRQTSRGEYHKTRHAPGILELLDPVRARERAPHCDGLFRTLESRIGATT